MKIQENLKEIKAFLNRDDSTLEYSEMKAIAEIVVYLTKVMPCIVEEKQEEKELNLSKEIDLLTIVLHGIKIEYSDDPEFAHDKMDSALFNFLVRIGATKAAYIFDKQEKWYS